MRLRKTCTEHYFEMSRPDSERALEIYKTFTSQTEEVVAYLGVARRFEAATRLEIPKLKHASTDLTRLLEDDLNDPDFDLRRNEYLAQKHPGRGRTSSYGGGSRPAPSPKTTSNRPQTKAIIRSDLIKPSARVSGACPAGEWQ